MVRQSIISIISYSNFSLHYQAIPYRISDIVYLRRVKVEVAKKALESSFKSVQEVMYEVGYSDAKAFRNVFKKITRLTPYEYRCKFNNKDDAV